MSIDWLKICRDSLKATAGEIMKIYASEKRAVEVSIGYGGDIHEFILAPSS
jgi:hypothetical protein